MKNVSETKMKIIVNLKEAKMYFSKKRKEKKSRFL